MGGQEQTDILIQNIFPHFSQYPRIYIYTTISAATVKQFLYTAKQFKMNSYLEELSFTFQDEQLFKRIQKKHLFKETDLTKFKKNQLFRGTVSRNRDGFLIQKQ